MIEIPLYHKNNLCAKLFYMKEKDRIVCLPSGIVWFVELKTENGKLSMLQKVHAHNLKTLQQNYACLWSTDHIDTWMKENQ